MLLISGCDDSPASNSIGVSLAPEGDLPIIHWVLCPTDRVRDVRLVIQQGDSAWDADDETLWEIKSREGSVSASEFTIDGEAPGLLSRASPGAGFAVA